MNDLMQEYKKCLSDYLKFKTISTDSSYKSEFGLQIDWLRDLFESKGFKFSVINGKTTNPYVLAEYIVDPKFRTAMVYGHYDVQPASIEDGWSFQPFELNEKEGRLYGRGVVDNKGQNLIHMVAIFELIKSNKLKYNIKFFLEGNEETGNADMADVVKENEKLLASDIIIVSDGEILGDRPSMEVSYRGAANLTLKFRTAKNNLHSGIYGGAVPSATQELIKLLSKLIGEDNKILIENYYEDVLEVRPDERVNNEGIHFDMKELTDMTGLKALVKEADYDYYTQTGLRPTIVVTGIKSGYIGEGYTNIVPATAEARINFRFVNNQDPTKCIRMFKDFVTKNLPDYVDYEIELDTSAFPIRIDIDSEDFRNARSILKDVFEVEPMLRNIGASIPVIYDFKSVLGKDTISISLGNEDCNMHGTDENFRIDLIEKGIRFSLAYFSQETYESSSN